MVNYLAKFLPGLSERCDVLRRLDRKDTEWCWLDQHEKVWQDIKRLITSAPVLVFYDVNKEVTIQCDASANGLGATLLQEAKPVCFASRALSDTERNYAQIEKELLAIVFSCEKFDQYIYRKRVTVESDHKPLETISQKPMAEVPKRLQRMLLRLQRYDLEIRYKKGSEMYVADTLSRAYLNESTECQWQSEFCMEVQEINVTEDIPISDPILDEIRKETAKDSELQCVKGWISKGWPTRKQEVQLIVRPYQSCYAEISSQNGLILKGDRE